MMHNNQPPMRTWLILAAMLIVAWLLVISGNAKAAEWGPMLRKDFAAAQTYWGGPSPLCSSIEKRVVAGAPGELGEASQPESGYYGPCHLYIAQTIIYQPQLTCTTMIHEDGHLHGLEHSTSPADVMYPEFMFVPGVCKRLWPS